MARKIFVSYKYADSAVRPIFVNNEYVFVTAREYVNLLQSKLDAADHINKGEDDGEDLSDFRDETIETKLKGKIFDSSITIVLISKNMKNRSVPERDQWIPWEVSYSLREVTRGGRTSAANAMLAVVLPDEEGSYAYFVEPHCEYCGSISWHHESLFGILGENMFNRKQANITECPRGVCGSLHVGENHSYIYPVKWDDFISNINQYLNHAVYLRENIDDYKVRVLVN